MKRAIVFAGGGSKGAYEVGAWKALNELGETFDIATGTSIGSINAAFYVQHDFEAAHSMWGEVTADAIMTNGINFDKSFESILGQRDQLFPFIKNYISSKGADVKPFHNTIQKYYNAEKFFSSDIDFALITVKFPSLQPYEMRKKDFTDKANAWQWLAASSACFPVFPVMEIDGQAYVDGGYYDNIPVASAFNLGAEAAVVIDLNYENHHEGYIHHPRIKYIKPSRDLGTFLNFDREVLNWLMKQGYNDTMKAYKKYYGSVFTFIPNVNRLDYYNDAAGKFLDILTAMESAYDFSGTVRISRINKIAGCTSILAEEAGIDRPDSTELFMTALEMYLRILGFDDKKDYEIDDLIYQLKVDVDGMYPMLEFDADKAFEIAENYIRAQAGVKNIEYKKYDELRLKLIFASFIRTLQHIKL